MTRINVGILPKELPSKLLLAELREIKRIPNVIKSGRYSMTNQPTKFTLGTGHVKFFYDKLQYLYNRYDSLHTEAINRGFNVTDFKNCWSDVPNQLYNDYIVQPIDRQLLIERINERGFELIKNK